MCEQQTGDSRLQAEGREGQEGDFRLVLEFDFANVRAVYLRWPMCGGEGGRYKATLVHLYSQIFLLVVTSSGELVEICPRW